MVALDLKRRVCLFPPKLTVINENVPFRRTILDIFIGPLLQLDQNDGVRILIILSENKCVDSTR